MSSIPLPKPAAARTLKTKYAELAATTSGRIDVSTENGKEISELLHRFFAACSNLYGTIQLRGAWDIFCELEPAYKNAIRRKDFLAFSDILRAEDLPYYILKLDELYEAEPIAKPLDRFVVNKKLIRRGMARFDSFYDLVDVQGNKDYLILNHDEHYEWANPEKFRQSQAAKDMVRFLERLRVNYNSKSQDVNGQPIAGKRLNSFIFWSKGETYEYDSSNRQWKKDDIAAENNVIESEKLMRKMESQVLLGNMPMPLSTFWDSIAKRLEEIGVNLSEAEFNKFFNLYVDLNNRSRLWCTCGWTPDELFSLNSENYTGTPEISFGPNMQKMFASGELDKDEFEQLYREYGFNVKPQ